MSTHENTATEKPCVYSTASGSIVNAVKQGVSNWYPVLEVHPCSNSVCGKLLWSCCDQFHCDGCGETFSVEHRVWIPDGTDQLLQCCEDCAYESKPLCPCCDKHAHMRTREGDVECWYECEACGARLDEAEITAANQEPIPACLVQYRTGEGSKDERRNDGSRPRSRSVWLPSLRCDERSRDASSRPARNSGCYTEAGCIY